MQKIGMRNIKTGIAVFFATLAGYLGIVETPVYTVSVCIFSTIMKLLCYINYNKYAILLQQNVPNYDYSILQWT